MTNTLEKFSIGVGDRFGCEAAAQLLACQMMAQQGVDVVPVWNKSNREHLFIGSEPASVIEAARRAVEAAGWTKGWHVDADHIGLQTVERFIPHADFFTIDVADFIGKTAPAEEVDAFLARHPELVGETRLPQRAASMNASRETIARSAAKFLLAVREAGRIHRHIATRKGDGTFIAEVSMDETDLPQTPCDLLVILAAIADEGIPVQTIAPKFTGRFNKGVDYVGDLVQFEREFHDDLAVVALAVERYGLPANLKLSVHSGSDKFSLYPVIRRALRVYGAGVHLKTAGTTWLEELIGLAESGGEALEFVQGIYAAALEHLEELTGPYATVIDIDCAKLPTPAVVAGWTSGEFTAALRHNPSNPGFNSDLRQLLHVAFKLAAKKGPEYLDLLKANRETVARNVTDNLYNRHLRPLFLES